MSRRKVDEWAKWTCPHCGSEHDDPLSIKETTCKNGHTVYLGPEIPQGPQIGGCIGSARRAFKTRAERTESKREDAAMRHAVSMMFGRLTSPHKTNKPAR